MGLAQVVGYKTLACLQGAKSTWKSRPCGWGWGSRRKHIPIRKWNLKLWTLRKICWQFF